MVKTDSTGKKDTLVYLTEFRFCFPFISELTEFNRVLLADQRFSSEEALQTESAFDEVYCIDIYNKNLLSVLLDEIHARNPIRYVLAAFEASVEIGGWIRERYGVSGLKENEASVFRNKIAMLNEISKNNICHPEVIDPHHDVLAHRFPLVVKPVCGFGASRTTVVKDSNELFLALNKHDEKMMVEEFIQGEEYNCNTCVIDGVVDLNFICRYYMPLAESLGPSGINACILYPFIVPPQGKTSIIDKFNTMCIEAMHIENAFCHNEYFLKDGKTPVFGEMAVRIGGGPLIGRCIMRTFSVNIYKLYVDIETGKYSAGMKPKSTGKFCASVSLPIRNSGIVDWCTSAEELMRIPGVVEASVDIAEGDFVHPPLSTIERAGYAIVEADTEELVIELIEHVDRSFMIQMR